MVVCASVDFIVHVLELERLFIQKARASCSVGHQRIRIVCNGKRTGNNYKIWLDASQIEQNVVINKLQRMRQAYLSTPKIASVHDMPTVTLSIGYPIRWECICCENAKQARHQKLTTINVHFVHPVRRQFEIISKLIDVINAQTINNNSDKRRNRNAASAGKKKLFCAQKTQKIPRNARNGTGYRTRFVCARAREWTVSALCGTGVFCGCVAFRFLGHIFVVPGAVRIRAELVAVAHIMHKTHDVCWNTKQKPLDKELSARS